MTERLNNIFGPSALKIQLLQKGSLVEGLFTLDTSQRDPLHLTRENGRIDLLVTEEQTAGHFASKNIRTLPAFQMLTLMSMFNEKPENVESVNNAYFDSIVIPNEVVSIGRHKDHDNYFLTRNNKEIAHAKLRLGQHGIHGALLGQIFEAAAQTLVAQMLKELPSNSGTLYPLVIYVDKILIHRKPKSNNLKIIPVYFGDMNMGKRRIQGSANVVDSLHGYIIAEINNIGFLFATARQIEIFHSLGVNFKK